MSSDSHVASARLRTPSALSSSTSASLQRRRMLRLSAIASTTSSSAHGADTDARVGLDVRRLLLASSTFGPSGHFDGEVYDLQQQRQHQQQQHQHQSQATDTGLGCHTDIDYMAWLDLDRFEDWDRPTLDALCPDVRIVAESSLFPIALADDGETLPSELHPSHPYGDLHPPAVSPYVSLRFSSLRSGEDAAITDADGKLFEVSHYDFEQSIISNNDHDAVREGWTDAQNSRSQASALEIERINKESSVKGESDPGSSGLVDSSRSSVRPNPPHWPFRRFGPGQGGPSMPYRIQASRPWRPYRAAWTDLDERDLLFFAQS